MHQAQASAIADHCESARGFFSAQKRIDQRILHEPFHRSTHWTCAKRAMVTLAHDELDRLGGHFHHVTKSGETRDFALDHPGADRALGGVVEPREHRDFVDAADQLDMFNCDTILAPFRLAHTAEA